MFLMGSSLPSFANAHGLGGSQKQIVGNYLIEFEFDGFGKVQASIPTLYTFELLDPNNTNQSLSFDRVFVRVERADGPVVFIGNLYPIEVQQLKSAQVSFPIYESGEYKAEATFYNNGQEIVRTKFDFGVAPSFKTVKEDAPSVYRAYVGALMLILGIIIGMVWHKYLSRKKSDVKNN